MALFNRWKNTVEKLTHPVVQEEKNTEVATEDEASIFAKAFLECLTKLENRLHGIKETKEVGLSALAASCDFYDADWCCVLDVDVKLKLMYKERIPYIRLTLIHVDGIITDSLTRTAETNSLYFQIVALPRLRRGDVITYTREICLNEDRVAKHTHSRVQAGGRKEEHFCNMEW